MIDLEQDPLALKWAEQRLGANLSTSPAVWLTCRGQKGTILGVVVFSRFTTVGCEITVVLAEPGKLPKSLALATYAYAFNQLQSKRVTAFIAVDNESSLNLAQRLGFRIEGRARSWFPSGDAFLLGLLREECTWLKDDNGQRKPSPAA